MNKFKIALFYICTLGIGYFVLKNKAKKQAQTVNTELTVTNEIPIDINKFIELLGSIENIKETNASINNIKVYVNDVEKIQIDQIKKMGAKGVMLSEGCVTVLFGDFSQKLSKEINKMLQNSI